jgi:hypothetical protein
MDRRQWKYYTSVEQEKRQGKPDGVWDGCTIFEVPEFIMDYVGQAPADILLILYGRASGQSYKSHSPHAVTLKASEAMLAERSRHEVKTVRRALKRLEQDKRLERLRDRSEGTGRFLASTFALLDSEGERLQTQPQQYRLCDINEVKPYITVSVWFEPSGRSVLGKGW